MKHIRHNGEDAGFSLVETLVTVLIFGIIMTIVSASFTQILSIERRGFAAQKVQENALFVIESVSREIRVSTITTPNTDCVLPAPSITINHPVNGLVTFSFDSARGTVNRNGEQMTASDVRFTRLNFCADGFGKDGIQSRVTIPFTVQSVGGNPAEQVIFQLQTSVSARDVTTDLQ